MSRPFAISSQDAILNIVEREHVTTNDIRSGPEKSQPGEKCLWDTTNHLAMNDQGVVDIDEESEATVD